MRQKYEYVVSWFDLKHWFPKLCPGTFTCQTKKVQASAAKWCIISGWHMKVFWNSSSEWNPGGFLPQVYNYQHKNNISNGYLKQIKTDICGKDDAPQPGYMSPLTVSCICVCGHLVGKTLSTVGFLISSLSPIKHSLKRNFLPVIGSSPLTPSSSAGWGRWNPVDERALSSSHMGRTRYASEKVTCFS